MQYTSFMERLFAGILDGFVFIPFALLASFYWVDNDNPWTLLMYEIIGAAVFYAYSILMHFNWGQTIGKWAMSINVIHANEEDMNISLRQAFLRDSVPLGFDILIYLTAAVSLMTAGYYSDGYFGTPLLIWFLIEIVTMLTNKKRRSAHDFIANTVVIKNRKTKPNKS